MELPTAPSVSIAGDGRVETRAQLRWGFGRDNVTMEGSLRQAADGELELTPMTVRSSALKLATPPLQPARRLRVAYADSELLVLKDKQGAVDVLWREGGKPAEAAPRTPRKREANRGKPKGAPPGPPPASVDAEATVEAKAPNSHSGAPPQDAMKEAPQELLDLSEKMARQAAAERKAEERLGKTLQDAADSKLRELDEWWEKFVDRQAASEEKLEAAVGGALEAIDTKLDALGRWDPLAVAGKKLQRFEDAAEAKMQGLDEWWEKVADGQAASERKLQETTSGALKAIDAKLEALDKWDPVAEAKKRLRKFEDSAEATLQRLAAREKKLAEWEARTKDLEERLPEVIDAVDAKLAEFDSANVVAEDAARQRLEAAVEQGEGRLRMVADERAKVLGDAALLELQAESKRLEHMLDRHFEALRKKLEEDFPKAAPDQKLREELRSEIRELEAMKAQLRRRRWPWSR